MSISDLFNKKIVTQSSLEETTSSVESPDLIKEISKKNQTFFPNVNFSDPSNFVHFGSAKEYYEGSIKRIYESYPYDGSEAEKMVFDSKSTYLDQWLLDNKYPKSTGYALFSADGWGSAASTVGQYAVPANKEYIYSAGGMHSASLTQHENQDDPIGNHALKDVFDLGVKYDSAKNRTINYRMKMDDGVSIQFWLKKDAFTTTTDKEVVLDLWNGITDSGSHDYGRLTLEISGGASLPTTGSVFYLTLRSGSFGVTNKAICASTYNAASIANGAWQHHTITIKAANTDLDVRYYNNGLLNSGSLFDTTTTLADVPNNINAYIGALQTSSYGDLYDDDIMVGAGKLSASMDDFRFWKKSLDNEYVYNTWYYPIGGGSNTDDYRTNLGVYYKFNEGITGTSSLDSMVLDYSGRIANGLWIKDGGYSGAISRNTGSAFASASVLTEEPGDPIIRSTHSSVQSLLTEMQTSGSDYDRTNSSYIYDSLPAWIREEDEANDNIKFLYQILGSYLDTLYVQIAEVPKLKDKNYFSASAEPYPFTERLLNDRGLLTPNSFVDGDVMEYFWDRNKHGVHYEQTIEKTKRLIYNNIYNNIDFILKSKGTEKSFRNLLRCYGVDDELVKLNVYTDNGKHYLTDRYKNSSIKTKVLDLNNPSRVNSSVTQTSSSLNALTFISGSGAELNEKFSAFSFEAGITFPKKPSFGETGYFLDTSLSSSLFGFHQADSGSVQHYTWNTPDDANLQVYAVKAALDSPRVKFVVTNTDASIYAESAYYEDVYNAERWNFQLSISPTGYPFNGSATHLANPTYNVELYGVTHNLGDVRNEFTITNTATYAKGVQIMTQPKRVYIGSHLTDFTGSAVTPSDVLFDSCRVWMDKLENESIKQHNLDPMNYGHDKIYNATTLFNVTLSSSVHIPGADSLILHWNFDQNTSADATGSFFVEDFSSGSTSNLYGWASNIIEREHKGRGVKFPNGDSNPVRSEFIFARRKELPEISFTDNKIKIIGDTEEFFIEDEDTTDNIFALEKSMYQVMSEEMLRTFATMKEYSNLFSKPVDLYRAEYKRLRKARELFFNRVEANPDLDRYVDYYKWIDSSLSFFIEQLKPASVTFTKGISDVVESHIFERPKYSRKFPTVKTIQATQGVVKTIGELGYNWKFGHSPEYKTTDENTNCLWQRERKERTGANSTQRQAIIDTINTQAQSYNVYLGDNEKNVYLRPTYVTKRFSKPYKLNYDLNSAIHGGINYNQQKNRDFVFNVTRPHGAKTNLGIPVNVFAVGVGPTQGITDTRLCYDEEVPNKLHKFGFTMIAGKDSSADGNQPATASLDYVFRVKGHYGSPFNIVSGTVDVGANSVVNTNYKSDAIITNIHSDTTYFENDVPMQGTFTETWVGGHQSRHVEINRFDTSKVTEGGGATLNNLDDNYSRPEAWRLIFGDHPDELAQDGAFGIVGPDYGGPYPDPSRKFAVLYRGLRSKRPYSVGNISGSDYRLGNYRERYEYFNSVGRLENNTRLKKAPTAGDYEISGTFLPTSISSVLPATTHPITLIAQEVTSNGNVFGTHLNARQPDGQNESLNIITAELGFRVAQRSSVTDGHILQVTGGTVDKQIEIDTAGSGYLSDTDIVLPTYRKCLKATGYASGQATDTGYSGLTSTGFSLSLWFRNADNNDSNDSYIIFRDGGDPKHYVRFYDDLQVYFENDAGSFDHLAFDTNSRTVSGSQWMHVVAVFEVDDLTDNSKAPLLWVNGSQVTSSGGTSYTAPGGTTPTIDHLIIGVDDHSGFQDITIWNTLLTGSEAVSQLYNGGVWKDPTTHASASSINDYYKFGEEPYWNEIGYKAGDSLDDIGGSIIRYISSSYGTGNNSLEIATGFDEDFSFFVGKGELTNDEIWNKLTSSLDVGFPGWDTTYISGSENARFFLQKDDPGSNTVELVETGTSFDNLHSGSGADKVVSTLQDQDTLTLGATTFTISHTTSGSAANLLKTGTGYKKALHWKATTTALVYASNVSYANPTDSNYVCFSFWFRKENSNDGVEFVINTTDSSNNDGLIITIYAGNRLAITGYNTSGAAAQQIFTDVVSNKVWEHLTIVINKNLSNAPTAYKNGIPLTGLGGWSNSGALRNIEKIYFGDDKDSNVAYEAQASVQDLVVWNGLLSEEAAQILHNSGSCYDIYGHPSAYYIWDWWKLGEESNIGQASGSALSSGTAVTFISPEIGKHDLTFNSNSDVFVTDGIVNDIKAHAAFWTESDSIIEVATPYTITHASQSAGHANFTATAEGYGLNTTTSETGETFTISSALARGSDYLSQRVGGAIDDEYLQIGSTRFIADADNSNAGGNYAKVGDHYYVYSSGSNDLYWTRLSGAIFTQFQNYGITSSSAGNVGTFMITASVSGFSEDRTIAESGTSFTLVSPKITGSFAVYETGLINVTQRESDYLTGSTRNRTVITSRFSAPGGIETQTYGYLDAYAREYSVHNHLNYRNLTVRGSGSGEAGTIRVESPIGTRDGLRALYQRSTGRAGTDSVHGLVDQTDYVYNASFHKVPRNTAVIPKKEAATRNSRAFDRISGSVTAGFTGLSSGGRVYYENTGPISLSFWIKLNDTSGGNYDIFYSDAVRILINAHAIFLYITDTAGAMRTFQWNKNQSYFSSWANIIFTHDGNKASNPYFYFNGVSEGAPDLVAGSAMNFDTRKDFDQISFFDKTDTPNSTALNGSLQEISFWNKQLTADDISSVYNNGRSINLIRHPSAGNLIDYWKFGEEFIFRNDLSGSSITNFEIKSLSGDKTILKTHEDTILHIENGYYQFEEGIVEKNNNYNYNSVLPASDYNYSWATSSLGDNYSVRSGTQKVFGYWPKDGLNKVNGVLDSAITFPTASEIYGE